MAKLKKASLSPVPAGGEAIEFAGKAVAHTRSHMNSSGEAVSSAIVHSGTREQYIRVRIKPLDIPPIKDGLIIGNRAAIGADAMQRTLQLVSNEKFELLHFANDDIVSHALVRLAVLKKIPKPKMMEFITTRLKPLMTEGEILMLDIDVEMVVEDKL